jgi:hypothetical protein
MIRADSTLADGRYGSVFPQGKQNDSAQQSGRAKPSGTETSGEGNRQLLGAIGPEDTRR